MRKEISEPQHWRSQTMRNSSESGSAWRSRRRSTGDGSETGESLSVEAIDAVFADESSPMEAMSGSRRDMAAAESQKTAESNDLLKNLSTQLDMLKMQQEHLQKLLSEVQDGQAEG